MEDENLSPTKKQKIDEFEDFYIDQLEDQIEISNARIKYDNLSANHVLKIGKRKNECREQLLNNAEECLVQIKELLSEFIHKSAANKFFALSKPTATIKFSDSIRDLQQDTEPVLRTIGDIIESCNFKHEEISSSHYASDDLSELESNGYLEFKRCNDGDTKFVFDMTHRFIEILVTDALFPPDQDNEEPRLVDLVFNYVGIKFL